MKAVIRKWRKGDKTLKSRMNLTPNNVVSLLEVVMLTTYFQFGGEVYQQVHRPPIWNLVSVVVVDRYMEDLKDEAVDRVSRF